MQEVIYSTTSTISVFLVDGTGTPLSAVVTANLDPYIAFVGGSAVQITGGDFTLTEVDAVNMTGWYWLEIDGSYFSSRGAAVLTLNPVTITFPLWVEELQVVSQFKEESLRRILGLSKENMKLTPATWNSLGFMETGELEICDDNGLTSSIKKYDITATYDAVSGKLLSYQMVEQ